MMCDDEIARLGPDLFERLLAQLAKTNAHEILRFLLVARHTRPLVPLHLIRKVEILMYVSMQFVVRLNGAVFGTSLSDTQLEFVLRQCAHISCARIAPSRVLKFRERVLRLLEKHCTRLTRLEVETKGLEPAMFPALWPRLTTLAILSRHDDETHKLLALCTRLESIESLPALFQTSQRLALSTAPLLKRYVSVNTDSRRRLVRFLQHARNLEFLQLNNYSQENEWLACLGNMPKLRHLSLNYYRPNLQGQQQHTLAVAQFLERNGHAITSLDLWMEITHSRFDTSNVDLLLAKLQLLKAVDTLRVNVHAAQPWHEQSLYRCVLMFVPHLQSLNLSVNNNHSYGNTTSGSSIFFDATKIKELIARGTRLTECRITCRGRVMSCNFSNDASNVCGCSKQRKKETKIL
jgi:hypothetical protein